MSEWKGFDQLDLSDVEADSGDRRLRPGWYVCEITDVELGKTKDNKGRKVFVTLADTDGHGSITDYINVHLPGKEKATQIGRKRLKTLLVHCGYENPDKPGDLRQIVGNVVGVYVSESEYVDANGEDRIGSEVDSWHPYFHPDKKVPLGPIERVVPSNDSAKQSSPSKVETSDFDDDIPF